MQQYCARKCYKRELICKSCLNLRKLTHERWSDIMSTQTFKYTKLTGCQGSHALTIHWQLMGRLLSSGCCHQLLRGRYALRPSVDPHLSEGPM